MHKTKDALTAAIFPITLWTKSLSFWIPKKCPNQPFCVGCFRPNISTTSKKNLIQLKAVGILALTTTDFYAIAPLLAKWKYLFLFSFFFSSFHYPWVWKTETRFWEVRVLLCDVHDTFLMLKIHPSVFHRESHNEHSQIWRNSSLSEILLALGRDSLHYQPMGVAVGPIPCDALPTIPRHGLTNQDCLQRTGGGKPAPLVHQQKFSEQKHSQTYLVCLHRYDSGAWHSASCVPLMSATKVNRD